MKTSPDGGRFMNGRHTKQRTVRNPFRFIFLNVLNIAQDDQLVEERPLAVEKYRRDGMSSLFKKKAEYGGDRNYYAHPEVTIATLREVLLEYFPQANHNEIVEGVKDMVDDEMRRIFTV
jgi:hypothetical protein